MLCLLFCCLQYIFSQISILRKLETICKYIFFFYIGNFIQNEIDLETFVTLTSHDLMELGVKSFIERKRLILSINQLKSERFAGAAAAPGAERRSSCGIIQDHNMYHIP